MARPEIYVSTDIETDGPIPGPHSMLSFASVAFDQDGKEIGSFSANLETLEGATGEPHTMKWWQGQPEAWEACRQNLRAPEEAMVSYRNWLEALPGNPVFVGYPAGFDFTFIYWYLMKFANRSPFSFSALDIKTYACAMLKTPYRQTAKRNIPQEWFPKDMPHTHVAEEDAREQGYLFMNMRKHNHDNA